MGSLSITEMISLLKKYFFRILALSAAAGLLGGFAASAAQTYTCTLGFKYNNEEAADGFAPDGKSRLDPYEIQNPAVIQAALEDMGLTDGGSPIMGIRQNISINKVITDLDREISDSAALLGEKYEAEATEYEMKFTYKASLGDDFGARMFSCIINEYDKFFLAKYYDRETIEDFAKVVKDSDAEYIVIADTISESLEDIIGCLDTLAAENPDYRSKKTGYTFGELSEMYQNIRDIQYAKYYGNIRAGNLAKDSEMVIRSCQAKVDELWERWSVDFPISENYKNEITAFYNSYKAAGLYRQAEQVQENADSSNNRDEDVFEDEDLKKYTNTYDDIVLSYTDYAGNAADALRDIDNYNMIIASYAEDAVPQSEKDSLLEKNEEILAEIAALSESCGRTANETIGEFYTSLVNSDLQYLILPEVRADKPVGFIAVFLMALTFGLTVAAIFVARAAKEWGKL